MKMYGFAGVQAQAGLDVTFHKNLDGR